MGQQSNVFHQLCHGAFDTPACRQAGVFTRNEYKDELVNSFKYCQLKKGLEIFAWCIIPSHVHMLISSNDKPLEDIVRDIKSHT